MNSQDTVFVTGFPGFIAGRLIERLAIQGQRFLLLVQPDLRTRAHSDLARIVSDTRVPADSFRIVEGDITDENLALSPSDRELVRAEARVVFHLAAVYDLAIKQDLAFAVNVDGTHNVNRFVRSLRDLRRYHYVSTCYVSGKRTGVIYEHELKHEAGFRNYYEQSKYLAELEVEALKPELPVTIHRPSVVCGDSETGETVKFDGVYYLINYLLRMPRAISLFNIGNQQVSLNLVPVDFVVNEMVALAEDEESIGKTVQIADPSPLTTADLFDTIATTIHGRGSRFRFPTGLVELFLKSPISPPLTQLPHPAVPYFFIKQTYDTSVSSELLAKRGLKCPPFKSYVKNIIDYAKAVNSR
ncbi:MAG TPA: SDR family oxidoreductase [Pyrinomonadaceae bacterium]|nr:SDR family oxidoreductase [Pyrinomonadaceae bacterium]